MKRYRRLRRLQPDAELIRRRAAGETVRRLAPDYGVSHTTLSRYFARPDVANELKRAARLERAEQQAGDARQRAEQKAERAARRLDDQRAAATQAAARRAPAAAGRTDTESAAPTVKQPAAGFPVAATSQAVSTQRRRRPVNAYHAWLDDHDRRRGIIPPSERRRTPRR